MATNTLRTIRMCRTDLDDIDAILARLQACHVFRTPEEEALAEQRRASEAAEERLRRERRRLAEAGFPDLTLQALDNILQHGDHDWFKARNRLAKTVRKPGAIAALHGPCGTGKTVMAASVARWMNRMNHHVRYVKAYDFCLALRESRRESDVMESFSRPRLLVIDEFHELKSSEFSRGAMDRLVDARHQSRRSTILISNLRADALADALGAAIMSRLRQSGAVIPCEWPSFRDLNPAPSQP